LLNSCSTWKERQRPPEPLQLAEHLWPRTNAALANRQVAAIADLEDAQAQRCVAVQARPDLIRSTTQVCWWSLCIRRRQGPRRNWNGGVWQTASYPC
jgi:hypothetical protein